jgi:tRNA U55 pseudouridine synthase TruB
MGCKQLKHFLRGNKSYAATGKLGEETDTYNDTGTVVASKDYGNTLY